MSTVWYCPRITAAAAMNNLASGGQGTISNTELKHPGGSYYPAGCIVGLNAQIEIHVDNANITARPNIVCMIIPGNISVPTVITEQNKVDNERYIWFQGKATFRGLGGHMCFDYKTTTKRRYQQGDRIVFVCVNGTANAFGANATANMELDAYLLPD